MKKTRNVSITTSKFFRKQGNILEIAITGTSRKNLLILVEKYFREIGQRKFKLASKKPLFITTPNPEQLVMVHKDREFKKIIQGSDISLCDGIGLLCAYEFLQYYNAINKINTGWKRKVSESLPMKYIYFIKCFLYILKHGCSSDGMKIIKGRDFMVDLLKIAEENQFRVFLLGSTDSVLKKTLRKLSLRFPSVHFMTDAGARLDSNSVPLNKNQNIIDRKVLVRINKFNPHFLFVAFGAPKQEKWVYRNIDNLRSDLIMVVGSSFEYIAGTRKRVPVVIEKIGLEWLWRIITGSQNIRRIFNAVFKFPLIVAKEA